MPGAKQTTNSKGYNYDMPKAVPYSLVHGHTWSLWCRFGCQRSTHVNLITMIERHGLDFNGVYIAKRAICKECGKRLHITGGVSVAQLRGAGHAHRLLVTDGSNFRRPDFDNTAGGPPW